MAYQWLTFGQAKSELAIRLNDTTFVSPDEAGLYIAWAMREWSALTQFWISEYPVTLTPPFSGNWFQANGAGSPRQPTLSDIDLYTMIEYMLLEPPSGGTWTGTPQFSIAALSQAVQGRRDESLQVGATNLAEISLALPLGGSRVTLPDNVLDVLRVRYVPQTGGAFVLQRGDFESFRNFTPNYLQATTPPLRWDVISGPPLALTVDASPNIPASLQAIVMQAEPIPAPPAATPLGIPDDWAWVPLFGALYDLLSAQEESLDELRAKYCESRYRDGLEMMRRAPWVIEQQVNGVAVDAPGVVAADRFNYNWQTTATAFPGLVLAGTDLYAVSPVPTSTTSVTLSLVANAPVPTSDSQEIQVPRDVMDAMLDYSEHLAQFKRGGAEFLASLDLYKSFLATAKQWQRRIRMSGIFPTTLRSQSPKNDRQQPRFSMEEK